MSRLILADICSNSILSVVDAVRRKQNRVVHMIFRTRFNISSDLDFVKITRCTKLMLAKILVGAIIAMYMAENMVEVELTVKRADIFSCRRLRQRTIGHIKRLPRIRG